MPEVPEDSRKINVSRLSYKIDDSWEVKQMGKIVGKKDLQKIEVAVPLQMKASGARDYNGTVGEKESIKRFSNQALHVWQYPN